MANSQHVYAVPDDDELAALVGSATPHFALQARDRIASLMLALPPDHPRRATLGEHLARLELIARAGEGGGQAHLDLRPLASLRSPGS